MNCFVCCIYNQDPTLVAISNTTTISELLTVATNISSDTFSSAIGDSIVSKLSNLVSDQNLTSSDVDDSIKVLTFLVSIQEEILKTKKNFIPTDNYIAGHINASGKLLDTNNQTAWLSLNSNNGAPAFVESMERFGRLISSSMPNDDNKLIKFATDNIVLTFTTVTKSMVQPISFDGEFSAGNGIDNTKDSSSYISSSVLSYLLKETGADKLAVSNVVLKGVQEFLPPSLMTSEDLSHRSIGDLRKMANDLPHTDVVSLSILEVGKLDSLNYNLPNPIDIRYTNVEFQNNSEFRCAYYQFKSNTWSSNGVTTEILGEGNILCSSTHLTSFSVLTSVQGAVITDSLRYITYVGCGISLVCMVLALICLIYFRSDLYPQKNFVNINFLIALTLAVTFFLAGIDQSSNRATCKAMTIIMHYLFLAAFCWMLCEGILLYLMIVVIFDSGKTYYRQFLALGWGLPAVVVAISVGIKHDDYGSYDYCFLTHHYGLIYAFIAPMIAIILANFVIFVIVLKIVIESKGKSDMRERKQVIKASLRAIAVLLPILGLTWIIGVFAVDSLSVYLAHTFTIFNSLQGLFVFIFHCVLNNGVRKGFQKLKESRKRRKEAETFTMSNYSWQWYKR
ncbi:latrophilin-like protein LAT-2 [Corticium candelabrum]|uniref:latrophilin-like protein LAT-2 n=1 Tax=Corticium candelabrum TaxID=121492 RepID=UPI002E2659F3|nr:latrophilin-like protein LAT-2 [Corticium candelabrum]